MGNISNVKGEKSEKHVKTDAPSASTLHTPKASHGFKSIDDLPDAEMLAALNLNVRSVNPLEKETQAQAVDRELNIPQRMAVLMNSPQDEMENPRNAVQLATWTKGAPSWLPKGVMSDSGFVIIDGNRTVISLKRLNRDFPNGHELTLVTHGPKGERIEEKVKKSYKRVAVEVFTDLTEAQFRRLQDLSFNKLGMKVGDVLNRVCNVIRADRKLSEEQVVHQVGADLFKVYAGGGSQNANWYHNGVVSARRLAELPPDIQAAAVAKANNVPGAVYPTEGQVKELLTLHQAEHGKWDNGSFKTTFKTAKAGEVTAKVDDIRWNGDMTTGEIAALYDTIAKEKGGDAFLGGPGVAEKGSDRSDFLKKWIEVRGTSRTGSGSGTKKALSAENLTALESTFQSTIFTKRLMSAFANKTDAIDMKLAASLLAKFDAPEVHKCIEKHLPKLWADITGKLQDAVRSQNAKLQAAKDALAAK